MEHFSAYYKDPRDILLEVQLKEIKSMPMFFNNEYCEAIGTHVYLEDIEIVLKSFSMDRIPGLDSWFVKFFLQLLDLVGEEHHEVVEESRT